MSLLEISQYCLNVRYSLCPRTTSRYVVFDLKNNTGIYKVLQEKFIQYIHSLVEEYEEYVKWFIEELYFRSETEK